MSSYTFYCFREMINTFPKNSKVKFYFYFLNSTVRTVTLTLNPILSANYLKLALSATK